MKKWFMKMAEKYRSFMCYRYGADELSRFMSTCTLIFLLISIIPFPSAVRYGFYTAALVIIILNALRTCSKNIAKRQKERNVYLKIRNRFNNWRRLQKDRWKDRKTHRYYKCPKCKAIMRISFPGHNRKITVTCRKCGNRFDKHVF